VHTFTEKGSGILFLNIMIVIMGVVLLWFSRLVLT
jgi:hypothetical protein